MLRSLLKPLGLCLALTAGLLAALPSPAQAELRPRVIRFGYGLAEDSNQGRAVRFFAEELLRLSAGQLKVRSFGGASLGADIQMQNALIGGAQEMMVGSTATLVGIVKVFGLYDLPFLFNDVHEADAVLDGPFGQKLLTLLPAHGLIGLTYWENGFRDLTNTRRPITRLEDLAGVKLRVMQNPLYIDVFDAFGAHAVPLPFSELFTALETGTVDGQENPLTTIQSDKFYEVQRYLSLTHHVYSPWILLASGPWWNGLSAEEQALIRQAAAAARDFERADTRRQAAQALAFLEAQGMQVNRLPVAEIERMRERAQPASERFAAEIGPQWLSELQAAISQARQH
ncbi:tripartite ATP-independent transporter DctP family solute receptor [Plasticicumulans acidivorans]|uniref:Tripartite ATP-independent transporter DctP family solute receptor n=1 Tax=Plasticicumulans acidivorans TaxID=886464 RepID=A0A317MXJ1_9GAMM|nr:tripartite ATP-independent transporter DctP family solute receptor [Plasticicumulans acidivorans]